MKSQIVLELENQHLNDLYDADKKLQAFIASTMTESSSPNLETVLREIEAIRNQLNLITVNLGIFYELVDKNKHDVINNDKIIHLYSPIKNQEERRQTT